ncbi:MAG: LytTR family transcriptional regulator [Lachnospiraceae bacterium]|nr:LytTR family transcriptional regulator [Lachnospiraceae bacterium]
MKVKIEIDPDIDDCEVVIRCSGVSEKVTEIQKLLTKSSPGVSQISLYKDDSEYFIPLESVLFFETEGGSIRAHTANDKFDVKYRLYELVEKLPSYFLRISKSAILNTRRIYSITKNLTGASKIEFQDTYKTVYCSRNYYRALKDMITP